MYDQNAPESFENIEKYYLNLIKEQAPNNCTIILVGNKSDLSKKVKKESA